MKKVYVVVDLVAMGALEVDEKQSLLEAIQEVYPDVKRVREHEKGSPVIIASTKDDDA